MHISSRKPSKNGAEELGRMDDAPLNSKLQPAKEKKSPDGGGRGKQPTEQKFDSSPDCLMLGDIDARLAGALQRSKWAAGGATK